MVKDRVVGGRPFTAAKGIKGVRVPAKFRNQDSDTVRRKKCHHHLKLIHKALKKARQFEVGKLKRRLKAAAGAENTKLEAQLAALGQVDLDATAQQAARTCGVAEPSPSTPADAAPPDAVPQGAASPAEGLQPALRVLSARLLAAKCVRDEMAAAQQSLAALDAAAAAQERRQQQIAQRQAERAQRKQDAAAAPAAAGKQAAQPASDDDGWGRMLGSGSESDDVAVQARKRQLLLGTPGPGAAANGAAAVQQQSSALGAAAGGKQPKAQKAAQKKPKNRLGQRARRKMAEREFGHSAKHIAPANASRQPAATAAAPDPHSRATARHDGSSAALAGRDSGTARTADAAPPENAKPLPAEVHPSWAAKSAAKARLAARPAGTKVVFSDDGDPVAAAEPAADSARQQPSAAGARPRAGAAAEAAPHAADGQRPQAALQAASRVPGVPRHRDQCRAATDGQSRATGKRLPARLHPSWEAKAKLRKQMEHLPAPAGTKVVFDDSE